jgi:hypothetical protein
MHLFVKQKEYRLNLTLMLGMYSHAVENYLSLYAAKS